VIAKISKELKSVQWPMYGFNEQRTHAVGRDVRPPFKRLWVAGGSALPTTVLPSVVVIVANSLCRFISVMA